MRHMDFYSDTWVVFNEKLKEEKDLLLGHLQDPTKGEVETAVLRGRLMDINKWMRLPQEQSADLSRLDR